MYSYRMIGVDLNILIESDGGESVTFAAPTTRDFAVEVTIVDSFGSNVYCGDDVPCPFVEKLNLETPDVVADVTDVLVQVHNGTEGKAAFLSGIDAASMDNETDTTAVNMQVLVEAFEGSVSGAEEQTTSSLSVDLAVLDALVQAALTEYPAGLDLTTTVKAVAASMTDDNMDVSTAAQFVDVVDTVVGSDVVDAEDAAVTAVEYGDCFQTVCGAVEDGEVPNGEVATLNVSSFELACSSGESGVLVDVGSDGAAIVSEDDSGEDVATVAMATWKNNGGNVSDVGENETVVKLDVVTVHVTGLDGSNVVDAVDIEDTAVTLVLGVGSSGELE